MKLLAHQFSKYPAYPEMFSSRDWDAILKSNILNLIPPFITINAIEDTTYISRKMLNSVFPCLTLTHRCLLLGKPIASSIRTKQKNNSR